MTRNLLRGRARARDRRLLGGDRRARARWPLGGGRGGRPTGTARCRLADLGLAVRADLPARVERPAAGAARLLQPPQAARAAQEALLDLEVAVRAVHALGLVEPRLSSRDLELALVYVLDVLRGSDDRVDD